MVKGTPAVQIVGTSTPTPAVYGQTITLTATLSGPIVPTGTVTFYNGAITQANILGTGTLSAGVAFITVPAAIVPSGSTLPLTVGTHTINIALLRRHELPAGHDRLTGAVGGLGRAGAAQLHDQPASTQTTLNLSSPTIGFGQSLKFTATVSSLLPGSGTPTSTVTFYDGDPATTGTPIGTPTTLGNGVAVLTNNTLGIGNHTIYAKYSGDGNFSSSTSTGVAETVMVGSTITITSTPSASVFGQSVNFTASVAALSPAKGNPTAPDTITFYDGNPMTRRHPARRGPITIDSTGKAVLTGISSLSVATHTIYASFSGDAIYMQNTGTGTVKVSQAGTTTKVTVPVSSTYGQGVNISATVNVNLPGAGTLTGNVTFYDGLPSNNNDPRELGADRQRRQHHNVTSLAPAQHTIYAVYANDANFATSTGTAGAEGQRGHHHHGPQRVVGRLRQRRRLLQRAGHPHRHRHRQFHRQRGARRQRELHRRRPRASALPPLTPAASQP